MPLSPCKQEIVATLTPRESHELCSCGRSSCLTGAVACEPRKISQEAETQISENDQPQRPGKVTKESNWCHQRGVPLRGDREMLLGTLLRKTDSASKQGPVPPPTHLLQHSQKGAAGDGNRWLHHRIPAS